MWQSVIEDHVNAALRLPRFGEAPLNERSLYLVGSLGGVLQDKFSRIGVMYKAVAVLNYEHDLAARRLQHVWRRYVGASNVGFSCRVGVGVTCAVVPLCHVGGG